MAKSSIEPSRRNDAASLSRGDVAALAARAKALRAQGQTAAAARAFAELAAALPHDWVAQYNAGAAALEAGRVEAAIASFAAAAALRPCADTFAMLAHALALAGKMTDSRTAYERAIGFDGDHFAANWGLFEVAQLLDDNAAALHHQRVALAQRSLVSIPAKGAPRTTLLELCIAGTFQANIPLDFILDPLHTTVHKLYLGEHPVPPLPEYDVVFNTIADAPNAGPALAAADAFIRAQHRPALNAPAAVPLTARDAVAAAFADSPLVAVAPTRRATREEAANAPPAYPFLIRPLDSHAGNDLAKIDDAAGLTAYLAATPHADEFFLCAFVDYRGADGFYRKYRIVFVAGVAYPVHLAISPRWMIHYYNAPMAEHAWMRAEEAAFMRDIASVFDGPRADGLRAIADALPLDYFGIDCSIAPDGRVLLFEASTAMIVHMRDPVDLYPYKAQYVPRIVDALERLFAERRACPTAG